MQDAVKQTLLARVYDVAFETSLDYAPKLSTEMGFECYLKREDTQPVHSFKLRGAYNKIAHLTKQERVKGIIAVSAGNHAQGVALSAQRLGISALIVMPRTTPRIKVDAVLSFGADVELVGDSFPDAVGYCAKRIKETGRTFIHPFDDPLVIAGQGTVGREVLEQLPDSTHLFVPVGGGGLIAGMSQYIKAIRPDIKIISVEPEDSNTLQASIKANKRVELPHVGIFADGVAVKQMGKHTFKIAQKYVDDCITVTNDELCYAIKIIFEETRSVMEGAGALGVAGIVKYNSTHSLKGAKAVAICSGSNITFERLQFVAERTLLGSGNEALFSVKLRETPGALHEFCRKVIDGHNITQFGYRLRDRENANVFIGVSLRGQKEKAKFMQKMKVHGYDHVDLSNDDLTKEHIRYMIGGSSTNAKNEQLYQINFPERPGAVNDFLGKLGNKWNISMLHYRGMGGDSGQVVIAFEAKDKKALESKLKLIGYEFKPANSTASQIFLGMGN